MRRIAFFEDFAADQFGPIALLRPVFELLCGHFSLRERVVRALEPTDWGAFVRPHLRETYTQQHPQAHVNDKRWLSEAPTLLFNGRWLPEIALLADLQPDEAVVVGETVVALTLQPEEAARLSFDDWQRDLTRFTSTRRIVDCGGVLIHYPWDLVHHNPRQIALDHRLRTDRTSPVDHGPHFAIQGRPEDVYLDPAAQFDPFVVVDARRGPVWIEGGVRVQPFTRIEGPAFIGRESQLFRAHIREGTSIGPVCRVGGELEASILQGWCNKYHDGFLGHSYVCPWVNLGALTTNSDLKNDYSPVRVPLAGQPLDTGSTKVGCFIGDHTKTALASLINTGSSIGVMTMILPGGELLPKHIPSFTRLWHGRLEPLPDGVESSLAAARTAMLRRGCTLTSADERLLRQVFELTRVERDAALRRGASALDAAPVARVKDQ
jgi:UDP-N-acetylglucosamine diphosphorylase/glucosamine-1-phosphate N-acetyltransferase